MNKFRKLHKGMSLVEVLVAMTVFSVGTAAVTMAFATAVKYNTHNQRRDDELAHQQAAIQNGRVDGLELYGGTSQDYTIVYTERGGSKLTFKDQFGAPYEPFMDTTEYQASRTGKNDTKFDFQLKSFSTSIVGNDEVAYSKAEDKYKIKVINESPVNYDVRVKIKGGTIYQGDLDAGGYKHSSNLFCRSLSPQLTDYTLHDEHGDPVAMVPSAIAFGFKYPDLDIVLQQDSPMHFDFYREGFLFKEYTLNVNDITHHALGQCIITIHDDDTIEAVYPD